MQAPLFPLTLNHAANTIVPDFIGHLWRYGGSEQCLNTHTLTFTTSSSVIITDAPS